MAKRTTAEPTTVKLEVDCPKCNMTHTIEVTPAKAALIQGERLAPPYYYPCSLHA